jgi:hypothetical protein
MDELDRILARWVEAGVLSADRAEAIAAFERRTGGHAAADLDALAAAPPSPDHRGAQRGILAEAIGYVGGALALGALAALLSQLWVELTTGGRLALIATLGAVLGGAAVALRRSDVAMLRRLTHALAAGAALAAAWFVGVSSSEVVGADPSVTGLAVGATLVLTGGPVLVRRPNVPGHLVTLAGLATLTVAALTLAPILPDPLWFGLSLWAVGIAWALLARGGWVRPHLVGEVLGPVLALLALQVASAGDHRVAGLVLGVVTAGALVWLAVQLEGFHLLVLGAIGVFVAVPQLVFELFGDAIGAPATLLLVGLLLVVAAVGVGRAGREVRREGSDAPAPRRSPLPTDEAPSASQAPATSGSSSSRGGEAP